MNPFSQLSPESLHHAYIIEGSPESSFDQLCEFCEKKLETPVKANPDFWHESVDRYSISHARDLREMQMRKSIGERKKIFVASFNFVTREAQNALLKVLEEPTDGTHIFILTPTSKVFLDTVLSRVVVLEGEKGEGDSMSASDFIKSTYADRMKFVTTLVKDIKDEKRSKAEAIMLVHDIESELHNQLKEDPETVGPKLEKIGKVTSYLHDTSSSVKILLEFVATIV